MKHFFKPLRLVVCLLLCVVGGSLQMKAEDSYTWAGGTTINATGWTTKSNWILSGTATSYSNWGTANAGPGTNTNTANVWPIIKVGNASGTTPAMEGWNFRMELTAATLSVPMSSKIQGGSPYVTLNDASTINFNWSATNRWEINLPVNYGTGNGNIFNLNLNSSSTNTSNGVTANFGNVTSSTTNKLNITSSSSYTFSGPVAINATINEAVGSTTAITLHSLNLGSLSALASSVTPTYTITASGYTQSATAISATASNVGKYYITKDASSNIMLYWVTGTVPSVKENVYYAIKDLQFSDNSTSYYLSSTHIDANSNISNQTTPSPALVEKQTSGWYIKFANENSTPYLNQVTNGWTTGLSASGSTQWQIDYVSEISSSTSSGAQANSIFSSLYKYAISYISDSKNYYLCAQTSGAQKVYCDNGPNNTSTSANYKMYSTFAFIPMLKVTYNYKDGDNTLSTSTAYLMSGEAYPTVTAPNGYSISNNPVPEGNVTDDAVTTHEVTYNITCAYALPKSGQIFQLRANGQYFSNTADNTFSGNGTGASTYFHYDGTHLTSMQTGKQVSNSSTTLTNAAMGSGSTVSFSQYSGSQFLIGIGTYNIQNGDTPKLNTPGTSVGPGYQFEMLNSSTYTPYTVTITTPTGVSCDARYLTPTKEGFTTCTLYNSSIYAAGADETVSASGFSTTSDGIAISGYAPSIAVDTDAKTITVTYEKHETVESLKEEINANSNYTESVAAYNNCDGTLTKDYPGYKPYAVTKTLYDAMQNTSVELATLKTANENFCAAAIVLPSAGNFYRLKNVSSSKYISSATATHSSNSMTLLAMVNKTGNEDATIFGLNSNGYLYSYDKGYFVTGKLKTSNSTDYQATNATTSSIKMPFDIQRNGDTRNFTIVFHADRCLYGAGTTVDAGGRGTDGTRLTDAGYLWVLEPVQFDGYEVFIDNSASASMSVTGTYGGYSTLTDGSLYASAVGTVPTSSDFTVNAGTGYSATTPSISSGSTKKIEVKCTNTTHPAMFTLFNSNRATYPFRIPAITETKDGKLLAVGDYRYSGNDVGISTSNGGRIDIIGRTSSDNGANWSEPYTVAQGEGVLGQSATQNTYAGYGDAAMVTDASGKILVMTCYGTGAQKWNSGNQGTCRWISEDNGATFTRTTTFGGSTKYSNWGFYGFFTSGRIFQSKYIKKSGSDYYRVYAAACGTTTVNGTTSSTFVLYSDDLGETWNVLGGKGTTAVPNGGNEAKVEELPDGRVIVSSRHTNGRYFNIYTYTNSENATGSWANTTGTQSSVGSGDGTGTNGEIMILPAKQGDKDVYVALNTAPAGGTVDGSKVARSHVTIYYKVLSGYSDFSNLSALATSGWTAGLELSSITSAYSTMVLQKDGNIGFVWEENNQPKTSGIESYDIKYLPLSLATATSSSLTINSSLGRKAYLTTYFTALEAAEGTAWSSAKKKRFEALVAAMSEDPTQTELDAIHNCAYGHTVKVINTETKGSVTIELADGTTESVNTEFDANQSVTVTAGDGLNGYTFAGFTNAAGESLSTTSPYTYNGDANVIIQANWKNNGGGVITVSGTTGTLSYTNATNPYNYNNC